MRAIIRSPSTLVTGDWTFVPSRPSLQIRRLRVQQRWAARHPAPGLLVLRPPFSAERWNLLFLFAPSGQLDADQAQILARVQALEGPVFVICATPGPDSLKDMPALQAVEALAWKDLPGFDFSAYALGLDQIARLSSGATVYVQNDSVFGPFGNIDQAVAEAKWDLTGFVASATVENHISSFAFILRHVTPERTKALAPVLPTSWCYNSFSSVVVSQETQFARVASAAMTVGSRLFMPVRPAAPSWRQRIGTRLNKSSADTYPLDVSGDPTLGSPIDLLDLGFPFLKRSLLGKFAGVEDIQAVEARLADLNWSR